MPVVTDDAGNAYVAFSGADGGVYAFSASGASKIFDAGTSTVEAVVIGSNGKVYVTQRNSGVSGYTTTVTALDPPSTIM